MSDPAIIHTIGVAAVWAIFLSSIRFTAVGFHGLKPVARCIWHVARCDGPDKTACRRRLLNSLDRAYAELLIAITTPWSVMLLFAGMLLLGAGLSLGAVGGIAQLVSLSPGKWSGFDRGMDLLGALLMCTGMASIHAAVTKRRSISLFVSVGFAVMGVGIGVVTAVHP
ncbi:hypothetical protein [Sphingomonas hylomeconis]|uniref:Uncharacterized protein n=1 Tax=Sphingomonas hylomeconis TaxID=1395958 RepID=A0ABV7SS32_9SPHN|nr:hypothetical protein [Sphingomonas hylomeconis]